ARVDAVHFREIRHAQEVNGRADDVVQPESLRLQYGFDVVENALDAGRQAAGDQLAGRRIEGYLPGKKQETPLHDPLGIRSDRAGGPFGGDGLHVGPLFRSRITGTAVQHMSVERIQILHEDYIRLTERFKASWTFHQFLRGVRKTFFAAEPGYTLD